MELKRTKIPKFRDLNSHCQDCGYDFSTTEFRAIVLLQPLVGNTKTLFRVNTKSEGHSLKGRRLMKVSET
jgi:hypothetical protein